VTPDRHRNVALARSAIPYHWVTLPADGARGRAVSACTSVNPMLISLDGVTLIP
jgi:hypothetical protein